MTRRTLPVLVALSLAVTAPVSAMADNLGAAIVGGIIGGAIMNSQKPRQKTYVKKSYNSAARAQNREVQTSLNYFGFPAGTPDGVLGSRSRTAISQYQAHLGYPVTGALTEYERQFLVSSYNRAQLGGPQVVKILQRSQQGPRALLTAFQKEQGGGGTMMAGGHGGFGYAGLPVEVSDAVDEIAQSSEPSAEQLLQRAGFIQTADLNGDGKNDYVIDTAVTGSSFWCGQTECATLLFASTSDGYARKQFMYKLNAQRTNKITTADFQCDYAGCKMNDPMLASATAVPAPAPAAPAPAAPQAGGTTMASASISAIPMFTVPAPTVAPSLASYCDKVGVLTNSNGGYVTAVSMTDSQLALSEQMCLTRTYAIARGESMITQVAGLSAEQVDAQCDAFGPALAPYVAALEGGSAQDVMGQVRSFALGANMSIEQLQSTGAICLYSGYRRDKQDVALGAALLLVGAGQVPYAETVGHHLSQGFGVTQNGETAKEWYDLAITALDGGAEPVYAPSQEGRVELLKAATTGVPSGQPVATPQPAALPTFKME